jgi:hypothetical protein
VTLTFAQLGFADNDDYFAQLGFADNDDYFLNSLAYGAYEALFMIVTSILSCSGHSLQLTTVFAHAMQCNAMQCNAMQCNATQPEDNHLPSL